MLASSKIHRWQEIAIRRCTPDVTCPEPKERSVRRYLTNLGSNQVIIDAKLNEGLISEFSVTCQGADSTFSFKESRRPEFPIAWSDLGEANPFVIAGDNCPKDNLSTDEIRFLYNTSLFETIRGSTKIERITLPINYELQIAEKDSQATILGKLGVFVEAATAVINPAEVLKTYSELNPFKKIKSSLREKCKSNLCTILPEDPALLNHAVTRIASKETWLKILNRMSHDNPHIPKSILIEDVPRRVVTDVVLESAAKFKRPPREISQKIDEVYKLTRNTEDYLKSSVAKSYALALGFSFGASCYIGHAVQSLLNNTAGGLLAVPVTDYLVQTSAFLGLWYHEHKKFYASDKNNLKDLRKMIGADVAVCALIYSISTVGALYAGKIIPGLKDHTTTILCLENLALYAIYAQKNMIWWAHRLGEKYTKCLLASKDPSSELKTKKSDTLLENSTIFLAANIFLYQMHSMFFASTALSTAVIAGTVGLLCYAKQRRNQYPESNGTREIFD